MIHRMQDLPLLTSDLPGVGGVLKQRPEDFIVQEIPLYPAGGEGEHLYCEIEKRGLTTFQAISRLAEALDVSSRQIGYAGMKDAHAVTRQFLSIQGVDENRVQTLALRDISILSCKRHNNKLRLGHLAANAFTLKLRQVQPTDVVRIQPILERLEQRGMPNYFGEQRFGRRGNNDLLGAALLRGDHMGVLKLLLGTPDPAHDDSQNLGARKAFDEHDNDKAMRLWPHRAGMERRILARLMKTSRPSAAVYAIDEPIRRLWVSALQSRVFNDIVAQRIAGLDQLMDGDWAYKHENGACFHVENAAAEQPRCANFEISPTGPLVGYRMSTPTGKPGQMESEVLAQYGLAPDIFRQSGKFKIKGARRPLRVKPYDVRYSGGVDERGGYIQLSFTLPSGSFATVLMAEVTKSDIAVEETQRQSEESVATQENEHADL